MKFITTWLLMALATTYSFGQIGAQLSLDTIPILKTDRLWQSDKITRFNNLPISGWYLLPFDSPKMIGYFDQGLTRQLISYSKDLTEILSVDLYKWQETTIKDSLKLTWAISYAYSKDVSQISTPSVFSFISDSSNIKVEIGATVSNDLFTVNIVKSDLEYRWFHFRRWCDVYFDSSKPIDKKRYELIREYDTRLFLPTFGKDSLVLEHIDTLISKVELRKRKPKDNARDKGDLTFKRKEYFPNGRWWIYGKGGELLGKGLRKNGKHIWQKYFINEYVYLYKFDSKSELKSFKKRRRRLQ